MKKLLVLSLVLNFIFICATGMIVYNKGGITYLKFLIYHENAKTDTAVQNFEVLGQNDPPGGIVMFGDSLTSGGQWAELLHRGDIINRGISGDDIQGLSKRLDQVIKLKPAKVFLMVGANDLNSSSPADILQNYSKLVAQIRTALPNTKLYIQSILPVNNDVREDVKIDDSNLPAINAGIKDIATKYGATFIDLTPAFGSKMLPELTNDGVHVNAKGYLLWKDKIEKYVNE